MNALTLLIGVYAESQLRVIGELLKSDLSGLKVNLEILGTTPRGWVRIAVSGEDEKTALNCLTSEFGRCPERLEAIERFATIKGRITALDANKTGVSVDVGVVTPHIVEATIPLLSLQAQLVDGRKVALKRVVELFGLCENLPLTIKTVSVNVTEGSLEAMLAEKQLSQYRNWTRSLLDRLIILGATFNGVKSAVRKAECDRDVVGIESLGLLEHAIVCKLGTDAAGLIPKIGRHLYRSAFSVFNSERTLEFLQGGSALLAQ